MMVAKVRGDLTIDGPASTQTYTAYFHVPVPTKNQVPLIIEVSSDHLIDYRIIRTTGQNVLVAANMHSAPTTTLTWEAWVLIERNSFLDLPVGTLMPTFSDLPDSVQPYLQATASCQVDCTTVQDWADENSDFFFMANAAQAVCDRCVEIPFQFTHHPLSFDAYFALNWGNSCTGHAHAATALLRALGIPARTKLVLLPWYTTPLDMHWTSDYFFPDYGWVGMDTTTGTNPLNTFQEVVIYMCEPGDESPLFYTNGIDGYWHTSDKILGVTSPSWLAAHLCEGFDYAYGDDGPREQVMALALEAFNYEVAYRGIDLPSSEIPDLDTARQFHAMARDFLLSDNIGSAIAILQMAVNSYSNIDGGMVVTRYASDFEDGAPDWSHQGTEDEWELGSPISVGPVAAHSGNNCWGTDLESSYEDGTDASLLSPPIDLTGLYSAEMEFWIWNLVAGGWYYSDGGDYLWVEISTNGTDYIPFCSAMRGGSADPLIPVVIGWSRMDLDLTPYVGETVQIRFRFFSDAENTRPGTYIDDVKVTGRQAMVSAVHPENLHLPDRILSHAKIHPNPFNPQTRLSFELGTAQQVRISVFDMNGRKVSQLAHRIFSAGPQSLKWNGKDQAGKTMPSGNYFLRIEAGQDTWQGKMMLVR